MQSFSYSWFLISFYYKKLTLSIWTYNEGGNSARILMNFVLGTEEKNTK
jgi:hypothetical protein